MPVKLTKLPSGKVRVSTPNGIKAKATTMTNAIKQRAIINAADAGHPFTGKRVHKPHPKHKRPEDMSFKEYVGYRRAKK